MTSREKMLSAIAQNQPELIELPPDFVVNGSETESLQTFIQVVSEIGGAVYQASDLAHLKSKIQQEFPDAERKITTINPLSDIAEIYDFSSSPHAFENVDVAILEGHFGVAENGAVWITEGNMGIRILPFICQHLVLIVAKSSIVATMHQAYERIADADYGFGTFIAGPSKTADIEQSLVLGAHGPKSLIVFLLG
ncbi:MAG: lactate utilization protein B/C [Pedobacter sp.]|nr:MAG: lactate utilization protein B/C [Pedobacter sp.]